MYFLDLLGTLAFAITGAYKAKRKKLHILGVIFLGIITAVGGGTIRDLIIGRTPLFYLIDVNYLSIAIIGSILTFFIPTFFKKQYSLFRFIDSIGLSSFVIIGVTISFNFLSFSNYLSSLVVCVFLGVLTGFGGGIIRDAIMGDIPFAFRGGSNYATSSFLGALSFYLLMGYGFLFASVLSFIITIYFREIVSSFGLYKKYFKKIK